MAPLAALPALEARVSALTRKVLKLHISDADKANGAVSAVE
jgi:hypothetical protein